MQQSTSVAPRALGMRFAIIACLSLTPRIAETLVARDRDRGCTRDHSNVQCLWEEALL